MNKSERIEFRIAAEEKQLLVRAQQLSTHSSLAAYITQTMKAVSEKIIAENKRVLASTLDQELFFHTLLDQDPEPNEKLSQAAKRYGELKE